MMEVQINLEKEITFFKEGSGDTNLTEVMEISSPTEEEVNKGTKMEDTDILKDGGGWPGTATCQP